MNRLKLGWYLWRLWPRIEKAWKEGQVNETLKVATGTGTGRWATLGILGTVFVAVGEVFKCAGPNGLDTDCLFVTIPVAVTAISLFMSQIRQRAKQERITEGGSK